MRRRSPRRPGNGRRVTRPLRFLLPLAVAVALAAASAAAGLEAHGASGPTGVGAAKLENGKRLYRKYCGQCHALKAARAVGFGSNNGLGKDGGPSFNSLKVPFELSVLAVRQPFIGHEELYHRMKWAQIKEVSDFVATATRRNPILAQPVDG